MEIRLLPPPSSHLYQELLRSKYLSVGIYRLQPGAMDAQQPHEEDELYFVLSGRARFTSGEQTAEVAPGLCLFVPAHDPHQFHDIVEPLEVLVVFGPAEGTRKPKVPR